MPRYSVTRSFGRRPRVTEVDSIVAEFYRNCNYGYAREWVLGKQFEESSSSESQTTTCNVITYRVEGCEGTMSSTTYGGRKTRYDAKKKPDPAKVLTVKKVDLKIFDNSRDHHTDDFEISAIINDSPKLVVRRGQTFNVDIEFSRKYSKVRDDLKIVFQAGDMPLTSKGTNVEFVLSEEDKPGEWGAKILGQEDKHLTLTIFTPPNCFVGKWNMNIDVVKKENAETNVYRYQHDSPIYVLFNPWCKDDSVYMDDEGLLREYVQNETGKIYAGSKRDIRAKPWHYGQFESCILDVALHLLDISELNWGVRGNPVSICRKLSALVNSNDDNGVLVGNWSGSYNGGRSPLSWTGSVAILEEYWKTRRPVRYGQCWVFSGVLTTVCRALGIPCRSVTNFASAHDTDGSITIDNHFDENGDEMEGLNTDSVWNFHVWNETWMARPDLPEGFGGWQAIDATPQETSEGVFCCGPAPLQAIKEGNVLLPFDIPFVFAEVNADKAIWQMQGGDFKCVQIQKNAVGHNISTKAANKEDREDVTIMYKSEEGSAEERAAVFKANQTASTRTDIYQMAEPDVLVQLDDDVEAKSFGQDVRFVLTLTNTSDQSRSLNGRVNFKSMFYTGVTVGKLKSERLDGTVLTPGQVLKREIILTPQEYESRMKDGCLMDATLIATVTETKQPVAVKESFQLNKPNLIVKGPSEAVVGEEFKVDVSFTNPLSTTLKDCVVEVDGLARTKRFLQRNVGPNSSFIATIPITARKAGMKELIIQFNSSQIEDVSQSLLVFVRAQ